MNLVQIVYAVRLLELVSLVLELVVLVWIRIWAVVRVRRVSRRGGSEWREWKTKLLLIETLSLVFVVLVDIELIMVSCSVA